MDEIDGRDMGRGVGQLAGLLALGLTFGRLSHLLEAAPGSPPSQLILVASAFLGGVAWWLLSQLTANGTLKVSIFGIGAILLAMRISAPSTLTAGFLPSIATFEVLGAQMDTAWRIIRTGIPPVEPVTGLISILSVLMWTVGGFFTWGSIGGPNAALFAPGLVMYFQFAVFDREDVSLWWLVMTTIALGMSVISLSLERNENIGRARDSQGRPLSHRSVILATLMASIIGVSSIALASSASGLISEYGNASWLRGTGLGPGPGSGVSYDSLVGLRQRILNPSDIPVFTARLAEGTPEGINPYWKVDTLDTFNGTEWGRSDTGSTRYESGAPLLDPVNIYQGTTTDVLQTVRIQALESILAPTAGIPMEIQDPPSSVDNRRLAGEFYAVGEVSVGVAGGLDQGDQYQLWTSVIDRTADLGALATDDTGQLSPLFAAAKEGGEFPYEPREITGEENRLVDREHFLELPNDAPAGIYSRAQSVTAGHTTDFEAAWMLQSWFRDAGNFEYSTDVTTGHGSLVLDDWLNDETSTNYRTGYCEQFAAAMAVLARAIGIPSRVVWGFTPGAVDENGVITVRDTNAHAWVELWMEPYGWYPFDPTPRAEQTGFDSQPPSITAGLNPTDYLESPTDNPTTVPLPRDFVQRTIEDLPSAPLDAADAPISPWWLVGLVGLVALAGTVPVFKRVRRRRRLARVRGGDITAAWDEIVDRLTDLGVEMSPSLTPIELARTTHHALVPLAHSYSSTIYGGRSGQASESDLVGLEWWLESRYERRQRAMAAFSLRSMVRSR